MKKALIGMAVLGAFAQSASAQSNVTLYGVVDVGFVREGGSVDNATNRAAGITPGSSRNLITSGVGSGSRFGFRGVEDLGGGLSAFFQLENGFQADTGTLGQGGLLFGRQAYVGLGSTTYGSVMMGRLYSGFDGIVGGLDPFTGGFSGRTAILMSYGYNGRINNSIMYRTPSLNGVVADVQYGFGEVAGNNVDSRFLGGSVNYTNGPLTVRTGYQSIANTAAVGGSFRNFIVGAVYDFGFVRPSFEYAVNKGRTAALGEVDSTDLMAGVQIPVGIGRVMLAFTHKNDKLAANKDATLTAIGYTHPLSKRTDLYAVYGHLDNRNGAVYTVGSAIEAGFGSSSYNLGLRHTF